MDPGSTAEDSGAAPPSFPRKQLLCYRSNFEHRYGIEHFYLPIPGHKNVKTKEREVSSHSRCVFCLLSVCVCVCERKS